MLLCHVAALGIALVAIARNVTVPDTPFLTPVVYHLAYLACFLTLAVADFRRLRFHGAWLPFYLAAALSIVSGAPSAIFQPWQRFASFCMVSLTVGPLVSSPLLDVFRAKLCRYLSALLLAGCGVSLAMWILRIPMATNGRTGLLQGIFSHSMLLSPIAGICFLACLPRLFERSRGRLGRFLLLATCASLLLLLMLSASRAAFIATGVALLAFLCFAYLDKPKTLVIHVLLIVSLAALSFPKWNPYLENMERKMERDEIEQSGDPLRSRRELWSVRIKDFRKNPVFGAGFASMDLSVRGQKVGRLTGTVEPGSGWLFVLSSTGMTGFTCLAIPLGLTMLRLFRRRKAGGGGEIPHRLAVLVFFCVHAMAEGYLLSSGSLLFMLFWLHVTMGQDALANHGKALNPDETPARPDASHAKASALPS